MSDIFRIVLRDVNRYDAYKAREFDLPMDSMRYPIGRASKNNTKRELAPAASNAYIDSPVISREHAVLFANTSSGAPQVYISDCKSMHGTKVNGCVLEPNAPEKLKTGDVLQFGVDVNRNEEYFVARKYVFEARLTRPFSLGFTVPDAESEDDDVAVSDRRGSQMNPFTLDDSDAASTQSDDDVPELTMVHEVIVAEDEPVMAMETTVLPKEISEPAPKITVVQDSYGEEDDDILVYSSDNVPNEPRDTDLDSDATSVQSSQAEVDYPSSEQEVIDSEDEGDSDSTPNLFLPMFDIEEISHVEHFDERYPKPTNNYLLPHNADEVVQKAAAELPSIRDYYEMYPDPFADDDVPPLPPRPSAARPAPWIDESLPTFPRQAAPWDSTAMSAQPDYPLHLVETSTAYTDGLFKLAPRSDNVDMDEATATATQQADQLQTPPPMPVSDITTSEMTQPNRRTKVSIEEIVEEQPPTPTSIKDLKRKADVFEEQENPDAQKPAMIVQGPPVLAEESIAKVTVSAMQPTTVIPRRKKQPRSLLSKLRKTATYSLLGAAGGVAAFTFLATAPDAFFAA